MKTMTYESLSLLLSHLIAAAPRKDAWDIAEAVGSGLTALSAVALVVAAFVGLHSWRTQIQYGRRLDIASTFMKGLHDVRINFLNLNALTKEDLLLKPEDSDQTQKIEILTNTFAMPIRIRILEMRGITVQADILDMPEFERPMKSLFSISDRYFAVLNAARIKRGATPIDVAMRQLEEIIDESGYFERLGIPPDEDPLDREMAKIEDEARKICIARLKTREAWYKRCRFRKTKKKPPD